jgi:phosphoribosylformylglycinamidine synthase
MCLASGHGADIDLSKLPLSEPMREDLALFSESNSRFVIEVRADREEEFRELMKGLPCSKIGEVSKSSRLVIRGFEGKTLVDVNVNYIQRAWREALSIR